MDVTTIKSSMLSFNKVVINSINYLQGQSIEL